MVRQEINRKTWGIKNLPTMKKFAITFLILLSSGSLFAQGKFGILTFQLPESWETMPESDNLVLFNPSNSGCRIALFPTSPTPIDTEAKFMELRSQKINELGFQNFPSDPIEKTEEGGWLIMKSKTEINSPEYQWAYMFTFSSQTETTGVFYETNSSQCFEEIAQVLTQIGIEPSPTPDPVVEDPKKTKGSEKAKPIKDLKRMADPQKAKAKGKN